ncbi:MAG: TonB family protein [Magnetococcales bacterium]|nr:TonB family protein [Magnetococcales bacterium]MBF0116946.1 TonB family protein [Magnetococcales bacterium]
MNYSETKPWHVVLNISQNATLEEIKQAYRMLIGQYHPDKVVNLGDEIKQVAERKSREINNAYEQAVKQRQQQGSDRRAQEEHHRRAQGEERNREARAEEHKRAQEEERNRRTQEERRRAQEEERKRKEQEEWQQTWEKEERERNRKLDEEERNRKAQEERNRKAQEEERNRKAQEEERNRKAREKPGNRKALFLCLLTIPMWGAFYYWDSMRRQSVVNSQNKLSQITVDGLSGLLAEQNDFSKIAADTLAENGPTPKQAKPVELFQNIKDPIMRDFYIKQDQEEKMAAIRSSISQATDFSPEGFASVRKLGSVTGLSPVMLYNDPEVAKGVTMQAFSDMVKPNSALMDMLKDVDIFREMNDDLSSLVEVEDKTTKRVQTMVRSSSLTIALWHRKISGKIYENWSKPSGLPNESNLVMTVLVEVAPDGSLMNPRIGRPSGNTVFDRSVIRAIQKTAMVDRAPSGCPECQALELHFRPQ